MSLLDHFGSGWASAGSLDTFLHPGVTPVSKSNMDFVQKAAIKVGTFTPGGVLLRQQAMRFVELSILGSKLLQMANTTILPAQEYEIDKLGFTGQVLLPDEEDIAFPEADLAEPEVGQISYVSKRYKAEMSITYDTLKRVIMGDQLIDYLTEGFSKAAIRDLERAAIRGDTTLPATTKLNRLLRKQDGWLKRIQSNVVDAEGAILNLELMDRCREILPDEYFEQEDLQFLTSKNGRIHYEKALKARATALGDTSIMTSQLAKYVGLHEVTAIPLMPTDLTYNAAPGYSSALFCSPGAQLRVGYLDEMNIRMAEDVRAGKVIVVLRFDVAFTITHDPACVKIVNLKNSIG